MLRARAADQPYGKPRPSVAAWIFVDRPPRDRSRPWAFAPFDLARACSLTVRAHNRRVPHQPVQIGLWARASSISSKHHVNRPRFPGGSKLLRGWSHDEANSPFFAEVRERAVGWWREHEGEHGSQWSAIQSIAAKIGLLGETLRNWVRQSSGIRACVWTDDGRARSGLRRWSERFASCAKLTRSCARRARILPWRSSTRRSRP